MFWKTKNKEKTDTFQLESEESKGQLVPVTRLERIEEPPHVTRVDRIYEPEYGMVRPDFPPHRHVYEREEESAAPISREDLNRLRNALDQAGLSSQPRRGPHRGRQRHHDCDCSLDDNEERCPMCGLHPSECLRRHGEWSYYWRG